MAKRKSSGSSNNDTKVASIILGIFVVGIILFFVFSKHKANAPAQNRPVEVSAPVESAPVEQAPVETVSSESFEPEPAENTVSSGAGKIAFIIDDWGQTTANCKYLREISEPIAVSILPGLRHTKDVANCAGAYHKLAMLHLPLEAMHNGDIYPPNYIIKTTMPADLVVQIVEKDLDQLPSIEGVNNHMGSKATADRTLMRVIFKRIKKRGLFFVDSMTSRYSVSAELANEMGLSYGKRDVFLDNVNTRDAITKQIMVLAREAHRRGYAVAIGHDRHLTMQVIKDMIPWLERQGFQIVSIKTLLKHK